MPLLHPGATFPGLTGAFVNPDPGPEDVAGLVRYLRDRAQAPA